MNVSVVLTTARWGGLDVLFHSMQQQLMSDFEVILVDEFWEQRHVWASRYFSEARFAFVHVPPRRKCSYYDNALGFNTGIALAKGELVVFLVDYTWVPPEYLQTHWDFYKANPGWSLSCYLDRYPLPAQKMRRGLEDDCLLTAFEIEFTADAAEGFFSTNEPIYRERRGLVGIPKEGGLVEMPGDVVYLLGESVPLAVLRELNGLDERYDGGYGSNDVDLGTRANHIGWRFGLYPRPLLKKLTLSNQAQIPGAAKQRVRQPEDNYKFFEHRRRAITEGKELARVPDGWGAWG